MAKTEDLALSDLKQQVSNMVSLMTPGSIVVTQSQVFVLEEPSGRTRALARVVLNDCLQLTGLRVVDGMSGLFVSYPNDPAYKGDDYRSIFYPVTKELREHIEDTVLAKYKEVLDAKESVSNNGPTRRNSRARRVRKT